MNNMASTSKEYMFDESENDESESSLTMDESSEEDNDGDIEIEAEEDCDEIEEAEEDCDEIEEAEEDCDEIDNGNSDVLGQNHQESELTNDQKNYYSSDDGSPVCPVCLNKFIGQELGSPENCNHTFCLQCISEWSKNVNTCPIDRTEFSYILVKSDYLGEILKKIKVKVNARQPEDALPEDNTLCEVCGRGDREDRLLLCDACDLAYHCECLDPPLRNIPINQWFCPPCSTILKKKPGSSNSPRQQRVIPRTLASEIVRSNIRQQRALNSSNDFEVELPSRPSTSLQKKTTSSPRKRRKVYRRKKRRPLTKMVPLARTKQSMLGHGKSRVYINVTTKRRRKKRRYKKRRTTTKSIRTKRSLLASKPLPAPSAKQRIANHLGLSKPLSGQTTPCVKKPKGGRSAKKETSYFSIFGNHDQLMDFEEDFAMESTKSEPSKCQSIPGPSGYTVNSFDILSNIMMGQNLLHSDSKNVTICKDGSLKLKDETNKKPEVKLSSNVQNLNKKTKKEDAVVSQSNQQKHKSVPNKKDVQDHVQNASNVVSNDTNLIEKKISQECQIKKETKNRTTIKNFKAEKLLKDYKIPKSIKRENELKEIPDKMAIVKSESMVTSNIVSTLSPRNSKNKSSQMKNNGILKSLLNIKSENIVNESDCTSIDARHTIAEKRLQYFEAKALGNKIHTKIKSETMNPIKTENCDHGTSAKNEISSSGNISIFTTSKGERGRKNLSIKKEETSSSLEENNETCRLNKTDINSTYDLKLLKHKLNNELSSEIENDNDCIIIERNENELIPDSNQISEDSYIKTEHSDVCIIFEKPTPKKRRKIKEESNTIDSYFGKVKIEKNDSDTFQNVPQPSNIKVENTTCYNANKSHFRDSNVSPNVDTFLNKTIKNELYSSGNFLNYDQSVSSSVQQRINNHYIKTETTNLRQSNLIVQSSATAGGYFDEVAPTCDLSSMNSNVDSQNLNSNIRIKIEPKGRFNATMDCKNIKTEKSPFYENSPYSSEKPNIELECSDLLHRVAFSNPLCHAHGHQSQAIDQFRNDDVSDPISSNQTINQIDTSTASSNGSQVTNLDQPCTSRKNKQINKDKHRNDIPNESYNSTTNPVNFSNINLMDISTVNRKRTFSQSENNFDTKFQNHDFKKIKKEENDLDLDASSDLPQNSTDLFSNMNQIQEIIPEDIKIKVENQSSRDDELSFISPYVDAIEMINATQIKSEMCDLTYNNDGNKGLNINNQNGILNHVKLESCSENQDSNSNFLNNENQQRTKNSCQSTTEHYRLSQLKTEDPCLNMSSIQDANPDPKIKTEKLDLSCTKIHNVNKIKVEKIDTSHIKIESSDENCTEISAQIKREILTSLSEANMSYLSNICSSNINNHCTHVKIEPSQSICKSESSQSICKSEPSQSICKSEPSQSICKSEPSQSICKSEPSQSICKSEPNHVVNIKIEKSDSDISERNHMSEVPNEKTLVSPKQERVSSVIASKHARTLKLENNIFAPNNENFNERNIYDKFMKARTLLPIQSPNISSSDKDKITIPVIDPMKIDSHEPNITNFRETGCDINLPVADNIINIHRESVCSNNQQVQTSPKNENNLCDKLKADLKQSNDDIRSRLKRKMDEDLVKKILATEFKPEVANEVLNKNKGNKELECKIEKEIKKNLYPFYKSGLISKAIFYDILKKCVGKVLKNCNNAFNPDKISKLVCAYVMKVTKTS